MKARHSSSPENATPVHRQKNGGESRRCTHVRDDFRKMKALIVPSTLNGSLVLTYVFSRTSQHVQPNYTCRGMKCQLMDLHTVQSCGTERGLLKETCSR